ncbi:hypothetical protein K1T35_47395 (plasmid) [Pseudonocardia sp. DSM 110487]|uniref:hypothetical protein n=1 Tax=Pseudonocardia sp. DSM 110487 TaxID=2865833 RepID=UPI001C69CAAB|nr:hypothetical protein [Pseudonocardia sp. DSM 110487]QYN40975.1 hypothetical protein K1T35_47395 [Pseudonocardia sp. DSM 110487]
MSGSYDYRIAEQIHHSRPPLDALIMAAMMGADTENAARLRTAFPDLAAETEARYNAPGGILPND